MTDADKLKVLAGYILSALGENTITLDIASDLRRIADLLEAVPPEVLKALKAGTWKAVPVEPTSKMLEAAHMSYPTIQDQEKHRYADAILVADFKAMLAAGPESP